MNDSNQPNQSTGEQNANIASDLKAVAVELFKKSQRLPPLSLILNKGKTQRAKTQRLRMPPEGFEFADFYHL
ncbi:MAG TPA: hypothetical protein VG754_06210 [Verrucomicrobiae bacterium]|jgi:hypothetical protein|nr:hypothetical protein [Verrucomicrobiae bacterium]